MSHAWEHRTEHALAATPEQVWEAIATGPGIDSWYMGRSEIEPRVGGTVRTDPGGFVAESIVTAYDPPKRFGYRGTPQEDGFFLALDWLIEGRDGGSTVLRAVGSGVIGSTDWETEYDALRKGGAMYMHSLGQYLAHFAGRTATSILAAHPQEGDREHFWSALRAGLGMARPVSEDDRVRLTPEGFAPLEGVVDSATPEFLGVRTSDGLYRFYPARGQRPSPSTTSSPAPPTSRPGSAGSPRCSPNPPSNEQGDRHAQDRRRDVRDVDGVMESPEHWQLPYCNDEMGAAVGAKMADADSMLLGRRTYDEFAGFWPNQNSEVPFADETNNTRRSTSWARGRRLFEEGGQQQGMKLVDSTTQHRCPLPHLRTGGR